MNDNTGLICDCTQNTICQCVADKCDKYAAFSCDCVPSNPDAVMTTCRDCGAQMIRIEMDSGVSIIDV